MFEIYQTPLDYLYLILSVSIGLLALFLVIGAYHLIKILHNVNKVSEKAKDTVDLLNHYLWQPIKIAMTIMEKGKKYAKKKAEE